MVLDLAEDRVVTIFFQHILIMIVPIILLTDVGKNLSVYFMQKL